ncbi:hypothetical protein RRG08_048098 [Elysia crispata]|uniref:Uncharacterized protein n=1 Tax=Elysia crispata TaxID=231223 RepID=A0AAE1EAF8_9GAST|nr:hypothetical protein RRG08_048098 [Elysia crispata]
MLMKERGRECERGGLAIKGTQRTKSSTFTDYRSRPGVINPCCLPYRTCPRINPHCRASSYFISIVRHLAVSPQITPIHQQRFVICDNLVTASSGKPTTMGRLTVRRCCVKKRSEGASTNKMAAVVVIVSSAAVSQGHPPRTVTLWESGGDLLMIRR